MFQANAAECLHGAYLCQVRVHWLSKPWHMFDAVCTLVGMITVIFTIHLYCDSGSGTRELVDF